MSWKFQRFFPVLFALIFVLGLSVSANAALVENSDGTTTQKKRRLNSHMASECKRWYTSCSSDNYTDACVYFFK